MRNHFFVKIFLWSFFVLGGIVNAQSSAGLSTLTGVANPSATTASTPVEKISMSLRYYLLGRFLGKQVPVLDSKGDVLMVGTVLDVQKQDTQFLFVLQDANQSVYSTVKAVFVKDTLGDSYLRYQDNPNRMTQQNIDMEQRLSAGIGPLLDRAPNDYSSKTSVFKPDASVASQVQQVGEGETIQFLDPTTNNTQSGQAVLVKNKLYLKKEGVSLMLHLERVSN